MTNWTTERLTALRPGERFMYYRGDFDTDIPLSSRNAPTYRDVLVAVKDVADRLHRDGGIDLETVIDNTCRGVTVYQYIAVGRRRGADPVASTTRTPADGPELPG
jgi:hypothetical protein